MDLNERITEELVRNHFSNDVLMVGNEVLFEFQKSKNHKHLFINASKNKKNNTGYPEFIISFNQYKNFIIIIECKADINKHQSKKKDKPIEFAVDGVLHYIKCINKIDSDLDILGIAVSGMNRDELKVSNFLYKKNKLEEIKDKKLLDLNSYLKIYQLDKYILDLQNLKITEKAIEYNNLLHKYDIPETERATFISAILLALQNDGFRDGFKNYSDISELVDYVIISCENVLKKNKIDEERRKSIIRVYSSIKNHRITTAKTIKNKKTKKNEPNTIIRDFIKNINKDIYPLINLDNKGFDILGKFYTEFIKYAGSDSKTGLVLTPSHITDLFCDLVDLDVNDVVYDCCCGTGGFLVASMKRMIEKAGNDNKKIKYIKRNQLIGSEIRADMFTYACSNMMMRGDGKSHIYNDDCFDDEHKEKIKKFNPTVVMLNPPYSVGADGQLEFILNAMDSLKKGGRAVAIVQMSCALTSKKSVIEMHRQLMEKHTLEAVISMPDQLFYPVGVNTCIMVFRAFEKHNNKKTWFGYFKDDGFVLNKKQGRVDLGRYEEKHKNLIDNFKYNRVAGFSELKKVNPEDEWCAEAYMETDYSKLTKKDFEDVIRKYVAFKVVNENC